MSNIELTSRVEEVRFDHAACFFSYLFKSFAKKAEKFKYKLIQYIAGAKGWSSFGRKWNN